MSSNLLAKVSISVHASKHDVWKALTDPEAVRQYMMGANVESDWKAGSPIVWKGEYKGKPFEDKGKILEIEPEKSLKYSHYSPMSGAPDKPENYHAVSITLSGKGDNTELSLTQDKNPTEKARAESEKNWKMMLEGLKKVAEHH